MIHPVYVKVFSKLITIVQTMIGINDNQSNISKTVKALKIL